MRLVVVEMRRALHRRAIRVLIALALVGCALAGVIGFASSRGKSLTELRVDGEGHPAILADWWSADLGEGMLVLGVFFLILGGFMAGATVAGAEWRAGMVTTVLTWEPRRLRLLAARSTSAVVLAFLIGFALEAVLLAAWLPAVLVNGTTSGVDAGFWLDLAVAMSRFAVLTAGSALVGLALATIGRNTAFAVITAFVWMAVIENLARGLRPALASWLWGENLGTVITWGPLPDAGFDRGPLVALLTLAVYVAVIVAASALSFERRDLAAAT